MIHRGNLHRLAGGGIAAVLFAALMGFYVADRAGADVAHCQKHRIEARERAQAVTGSGATTVVIGDSWSVGLGLDDLANSWPAHLSGQVRVAGFSGSGFSATASRCGDVSFAARATRAVRQGADLVVIEGGLNDHDQAPGATMRGFDDLMNVLSAQRVVVVGPAAAPSRRAAAERVDTLLARLSRQYDVPYISTLDLSLDYLGDDLHLTREGHVEFGRAVAERLAELD